MSFDLSLSSINVAQIVQNYSLDDPDLATALAKEENYSSAKELFLHLLKDESLLERNKPLIMRLIKLIKPDDLNKSIGKELQLVSQKLRELGIFKLCTAQSFTEFDPNVLWILSKTMRKRWSEGSGHVSYATLAADLAAEESKYSVEVVTLMREYVKSRNLEPLLRSLLQSIHSDEHLSILNDILKLSKFFGFDTFKKDFQEAIKKCQIDLLPSFAVNLNEYRELITRYDLSLLACALDHYQIPARTFPIPEHESAVVELLQELLARHRSRAQCKKFVPLIKYLLEGISLAGIKKLKNCQFIGYRLVSLRLIDPVKSLKSMFSFAFIGKEVLLRHKKNLAYVSPFFLEAFQTSQVFSGKSFMKIAFSEKAFFEAVKETMKLEKLWKEPTLKSKVEKYLLKYEINETTAAAYLEISEAYDLPLLRYASKYFLNLKDPSPKDPSLKDPSYQSIIVQLFSMYAKQPYFMTKSDFFLHLFKLLEFDNIPSSLECAGWVASYLFNCSLNETTNISENKKETIGISMEEDPTKAHVFSKRVLKFISPSFFSRLEAYHQDKDLLIYDCSQQAFDFFIRHLSKRDTRTSTFIPIQEQLRKGFSKFIDDLLYLTELFQLDSLKKVVEEYLISQLTLENAEEFLKVELGMPDLGKRARCLLGHLRDDAKDFKIGSHSDLEACIADPEGVRSVTWGHEYLLTKGDLSRLSYYCLALRWLTLDAQTLIKGIVPEIQGFLYLKGVTIRQSERSVSINHDLDCLRSVKALKLEGFLIDNQLLEKLGYLTELESLDLSMCQLDVSFHLFYKFPSLKNLSLPVLRNTDNSMSVYLQLLAHFKTAIHLPPEQTHLLDKKMSEVEIKEAQKQLEEMIFAFLNEKTCGFYSACAKKYGMNHLLFASNFYRANRSESIDCCVQMLDFFIDHPFLIDVFPRLIDYLISSLPVDFVQWEEYREKGKKCGFDALVKQADYCLLGLHENARHVELYDRSDLNLYLDDPRSVKGVELKTSAIDVEDFAAYFPAITSLKLNADHFLKKNSLKRFKKLESLCFTRAADLKFFLKDVPSVKFLTIQKGMVSDSDFESLCKLPLLENLDLRGASFKKNLNFYEILNLSHLRELKLSLHQLLGTPHFSTTILDDLEKQGVLVEIDEKDLDLARRYTCPENVTDVLQYVRRIGNHILEAAFEKQLKVSRFLLREKQDLKALFQLQGFKEFSIKFLVLFLQYDESCPYRLKSIEKTLKKIIEKKIKMKRLFISNCNAVTSLSQEVFDQLGQLKSLEKLTLQFLMSSEGTFDLSPLLQLPHLNELAISHSWLENNVIKPENFYEVLSERNVTLMRDV